MHWKVGRTQVPWKLKLLLVDLAEKYYWCSKRCLFNQHLKGLIPPQPSYSIKPMRSSPYFKTQTRLLWLCKLKACLTNRSPAQVGCMRQVLRPGALGRPRGMGWGGRWEGGVGWGTHVNPWLTHVNVWQNPLQYCKVISLQIIKINEKKVGLKCDYTIAKPREIWDAVKLNSINDYFHCYELLMTFEIMWI